MKVLVINTVQTASNGITNVIFNLFAASDRHIIDYGYVSINEPNEQYLDKLTKYGIKLFVIPRVSTHIHRYIKSIQKIAIDYNVIHVHGNSATMLLELLAAKKAGVGLRIAHSHNTTCTHRIINSFLHPWFQSLCNGRIACGIQAGKWLFKNKSFFVVQNGINVNKFKFNDDIRKKLRAKYGISDKLVFGHVGNFIAQKNHDFLIDIFRQILYIKPNSILMLLGDGLLMANIKSKVESLNLSNNVIFMGSVGNPQDYLNAMDLIIMPSLYEGLPLSMIEAQCNGLSILSADTISKDADMGNFIEFMSLSNPPSQWASTAVSMLGKSYRNSQISNHAVNLIINKGFSISDVTNSLNKYYNDHAGRDNIDSYEK